jgi:hypothetical protein
MLIPLLEKIYMDYSLSSYQRGFDDDNDNNADLANINNVKHAASHQKNIL